MRLFLQRDPPTGETPYSKTRLDSLKPQACFGVREARAVAPAKSGSARHTPELPNKCLKQNSQMRAQICLRFLFLSCHFTYLFLLTRAPLASPAPS